MLNFDWLAGISQETAKIIFLGFFILCGILVLLVPGEYAWAGVKEEDRHWYMNLKLWSILSLSLLFFIYYMF